MQVAALPNDVESGVAAMPRELPDAAAMPAPAYTDDFSSIVSSDDTASSIMARPLVDDEQEMQMAPASKSYASSFDFDALPATQDSMPVPMQAGTLALPQAPDVFSSDQAGQKVSTERMIMSSAQDF